MYALWYHVLPLLIFYFIVLHYNVLYGIVLYFLLYILLPFKKYNTTQGISGTLTETIFVYLHICLFVFCVFQFTILPSLCFRPKIALLGPLWVPKRPQGVRI